MRQINKTNAMRMNPCERAMADVNNRQGVDNRQVKIVIFPTNCEKFKRGCEPGSGRVVSSSMIQPTEVSVEKIASKQSFVPNSQPFILLRYNTSQPA